MKRIKKKINESVGNGYPLDLNGTTNMSPYKNGTSVRSLTKLPYYSYDIVPLNHDLEPPVSNTNNDYRTIKIGNQIKGLVLNSKKEYQTGTISKKIKNNENDILYYIIISRDNGKEYKIDPTDIEVIQFDISDIFKKDKNIKDDIQYPRLLDFVKNKETF